MQTYIALLRGINVGGKNQMNMTSLREMMTSQGFSQVRTYINSGNLIFASTIENAQELKKICEQLIVETFQLTITVTVISAIEFLEAIKQAPEWWGIEAETKHNVIFVIPPATASEMVVEIGVAAEEIERVAYFGNIIFWSAPLKTFSKTRWSKIVGKSYYDKITIRNANTVNKLVQLIQQ